MEAIRSITGSIEQAITYTQVVLYSAKTKISMGNRTWEKLMNLCYKNRREANMNALSKGSLSNLISQ